MSEHGTHSATYHFFHYHRVAQIPLINTYPNKSNNFTPPLFTPQTLGILPNDVTTHAKMHNALDVTHDNPKVQHHLQQASQHLTDLDNITTTLYLANHTTTPPPNEEDLIPRTPTARRLINNVSASWKWGIE